MHVDLNKSVEIQDADYSGTRKISCLTSSFFAPLFSVRFAEFKRGIVFSICFMFRVVCCKSSIPLGLGRSIGRSFSRRSKYVMEEVAPKRHILPYITGGMVIAMGGAGVYMYKTNSFQMVEFVKRTKTDSKDDMKWRDAIATSLVAISNQELGRERILRHKWGATLGNWIIEDSVYRFFVLSHP